MSETKKRLFYLIIVPGILAVGFILMALLVSTRKTIKKRPVAAGAPIVSIVTVRVAEKRIHITGEGTVRPIQEITLVPEVKGKVVYTSPALVNGGIFRKGDILLRIEPVDYELAVTLARAKVTNSESLLQLAEQQSEAAVEEWRMHYDGSSKSESPPPLVAKKPQLSAARTRLKADRATLKKALLDLERTELKAPFDGRVTDKHVGIGQYVTPGQNLATLYSTNAVEIIVPMEKGDLFWFNVPGFTPGNRPGSPAEVRARIAGRTLSLPGEVVRTEGRLDERTRMVNVVVRVEKPYDRRPPLAVGLFVTVDITGHHLPHAAEIPFSALRQGHVVWVVDRTDRIRFRKVDVARVQGDTVLIRDGLRTGDRVVVSLLKAVTDGMSVKVLSDAREIRP